MSENQPFNNSSFNPASNSAFDKSQPIQGQAAPAPVVMQPVKSTGVAYLLWFFLGWLGIHKFYLNQTGLGILYLVLNLGGWAAVITVLGMIIGVPRLIVWAILMIIDIFLIPDRVNQMNGTSQVVQVVQQ